MGLNFFFVSAKIDTEIDWIAYMQQVEQYLDGERDYTLIKGLTGPLVYPAAHVYIYSGLYRLTDGGKDIRKAQIIFAGLYLGVLSLVMASYRRAKVLFFNLMPIMGVRVREGGCCCCCCVRLCLSMFICLGTIIHIPPSSDLEAASQHFPPEAFQRLFRRRSLVPCYLRLPKTDLGGRECGVFMGRGD